MNRHQEMVQDFHETLGATVGAHPELRDRELRAKLILEEAVETVAAMGYRAIAEIRDPVVWEEMPEDAEPHEWDLTQPVGGGVVAHFEKEFAKPNFAEVIDGLIDLEYVTLGSHVAFGTDSDPFFDEVHRANMTKLGGKRREDGKVLKPDDWQPPDIDRILIRQQHTADAWRELEEAALAEPDVEVIASSSWGPESEEFVA